MHTGARIGGNPGHTSHPKGFNFTDPDLYAQRLPLEKFAELLGVPMADRRKVFDEGVLEIIEP